MGYYSVLVSMIDFNRQTKFAEVGKAQLKVQSATSATSAIAEVALSFNFLFLNIAEVALQTKVFKICSALIAIRLQFFFLVNSAILYIEPNFVPFRSQY